AAQSLQHDADLLLRPILLAGRAADVFDHLLCRRFPGSRFLSHLRSFESYDEPEILRSQLSRFGPISADAGQVVRWRLAILIGLAFAIGHFHGREKRDYEISVAMPPPQLDAYYFW